MFVCFCHKEEVVEYSKYKKLSLVSLYIDMLQFTMYNCICDMFSAKKKKEKKEKKVLYGFLFPESTK